MSQLLSEELKAKLRESDVCPGMAVYNVPDRALRHAEHSTQLSLGVSARGVQTAYLSHIPIRKLGKTLAFASSQGSVPMLVLHVLNSRPPGEVVQAVIGGIAVKVPALLTLRTGANKGQQYETVNEPAFLFAHCT